MKNNFVLSFLLLIVPCFLWAQQAEEVDFVKPDYKKIKKEIKKKDSEFFYPSLMKRYRQGDSTMTLEERRHLYYGFRYQENYNPYGMGGLVIDSLYSKDSLTVEEIEQARLLIDTLLDEEPFNFDVLYADLHVAELAGDKERYEQARARIFMIFDAIFSSGDGLSKETALYVLFVSHEYEALYAVGLKFGGTQRLLDMRYDYLEVAENPYGIEGIYFDISPSLEKTAELFQGK